jgi:hypothetical protein
MALVYGYITCFLDLFFFFGTLPNILDGNMGRLVYDKVIEFLVFFWYNLWVFLAFNGKGRGIDLYGQVEERLGPLALVFGMGCLLFSRSVAL